MADGAAATQALRDELAQLSEGGATYKQWRELHRKAEHLLEDHPEQVRKIGPLYLQVIEAGINGLRHSEGMEPESLSDLVRWYSLLEDEFRDCWPLKDTVLLAIPEMGAGINSAHQTLREIKPRANGCKDSLLKPRVFLNGTSTPVSPFPVHANAAE